MFVHYYKIFMVAVVDAVDNAEKLVNMVNDGWDVIGINQDKYEFSTNIRLHKTDIVSFSNKDDFVQWLKIVNNLGDEFGIRDFHEMDDDEL